MISEINFEKLLLINNRQLNYKGIFRVDELFSTINRALEERNYEKREKKSEELITEAGRKTYLELRPFKEASNFITLMIKIKINLDNVTEVLEEIKGERKTFQQGNVNFVFDAWVLTDYNNRWGMKPWFYFLKGLVNKFLLKNKIEEQAPGTLAADTAYIYARIKKLLNSYHGEESKQVIEEDVRKQVEEELKEEIGKELKGK